MSLTWIQHIWDARNPDSKKMPPSAWRCYYTNSWWCPTPGSCPHSSWCDGILYNVFDFGSSDSTGASFANRAEILSANTVFDKIKSLGATPVVSLHATDGDNHPKKMHRLCLNCNSCSWFCALEGSSPHVWITNCCWFVYITSYNFTATFYGKRTSKSSTKGRQKDSPNVLMLRQVGLVWFLFASAKPNWCNPWATWSKVLKKEWERWIWQCLGGGTRFIHESWISQLMSRMSWNVMIPIPSIFVLVFCVFGWLGIGKMKLDDIKTRGLQGGGLKYHSPKSWGHLRSDGI